MSNVETDLEQLEQYLDGALEAAERAALQSRLKSDAALAKTLADLKAQRALRAAVWQSIEPDAAAADRFMWRVRGAMLQQKQNQEVAEPRVVASGRRWSQWRIASVGSAAAACLVLGFMFGRIGQSHPSGLNSVANSRVSSVSGGGVSGGGVSGGGIAVNIPAPMPALLPDQVNPAPREAVHDIAVQGNSVPITDQYGHIVAYQKFATHAEADQFAHDLHDTRPETSAPAVSGPSRLATEEH